MIEESPEAFIARWREYAVTAELFPHIEGSPLLEARIGDALMQLFERTGPYLGQAGDVTLIVHPVTEQLDAVGDDEAGPGIEVLGVSKIRAVGTVLAAEGRVLIVDVGAPNGGPLPLVVGVLADEPRLPGVGGVVTFTNRPPVHGFVLNTSRHAAYRASHG